jgi:hypothetical protein
MKLKLPDVSLVCIETREHKLACLSIKDCVDKIDFGDLIIITDRPAEFYDFNYLKPQIKTVVDWPTKLGWSQSWWYDVPLMLRTKSSLNIQWDSFVWSSEMWRDEFLQYDYIGAPWQHHPPNTPRVGNGGFSLVSARLKRYVYDRRDKFPCDSDVDDALLCIKYRAELEKAGFIWAPEKVAYDFSYEGCDGSEPTRHFGFHALMNFPYVLDRERLNERMELVMRSPNLTKPGSIPLSGFIHKHPALVQELTASAKEQVNG